MKRTQIYLNEDQDRRLERRARAVGKTKSALIRDAIDRLLARDGSASDLEATLQETLGAMAEISAPNRDEWDRGYG